MRISKVNSVIEFPQGIYEIRNVESGKFYVGSAVNLRKRWNRHLFLLERGRHDNIHLQRAWDIDGAESFTLSVLEYVPNAADLIQREQHWFALLGAMTNGYNLAPVAGSRLGAKHSDETKRRISEACKGRKATDETRERMSAANRLRTQSPEARAKISAARKGFKVPAEVVARRVETQRRNRLARQASQPTPNY